MSWVYFSFKKRNAGVHCGAVYAPMFSETLAVRPGYGDVMGQVRRSTEALYVAVVPWN